MVNTSRIFRRYDNKNLDESMHQWNPEDQNRFRRALNRVADYTMQAARLIASTFNSIGGPYVRQ